MRELLDLLGVAGIPSTILMFFVNWRLKKLESKIDEKEKLRAERDYLLVKGTLASISLGEAQAKELQKEGKVNGNTSNALDENIKRRSTTGNRRFLYTSRGRKFKIKGMNRL